MMSDERVSYLLSMKNQIKLSVQCKGNKIYGRFNFEGCLVSILTRCTGFNEIIGYGAFL